MELRSTSKVYDRAILVTDNLQLKQFQVTQFQTHEILKQSKETEIIRRAQSFLARMKKNCGDYDGRILLGASAHLVTLDRVLCCAVAVSKRTLVFSVVLSAVLSVILIHYITIITI